MHTKKTIYSEQAIKHFKTFTLFFQADPIGPPIVLFGEVHVNGPLCPLTPACIRFNPHRKRQTDGDLFPIHLANRSEDSRMEMDRRSVSIRPPHKHWVVSVHSRADLSSTSSAGLIEKISLTTSAPCKRGLSC